MARAISAFCKTYLCKLIPNWTRNRMITYANLTIFDFLHSVEIALFVLFFCVCIFASVFLLTCILFLFNADVNWLPGSICTLIFTFNISIGENFLFWARVSANKGWLIDWLILLFLSEVTKVWFLQNFMTYWVGCLIRSQWIESVEPVTHFLYPCYMTRKVN